MIFSDSPAAGSSRFDVAVHGGAIPCGLILPKRRAGSIPDEGGADAVLHLPRILTAGSLHGARAGGGRF